MNAWSDAYKLRLALASTNMSKAEAAAWLTVPRTEFDAALTGMGDPETTADCLDLLGELVSFLREQADEVFDLVFDEDGPTVESFEVGVPSDDAEAKDMGWPTRSCFDGFLRMVLEEAEGVDVVLTPRGSTPASAAAIEAREPAGRNGRKKK